jgi:hypothetical protein
MRRQNPPAGRRCQAWWLWPCCILLRQEGAMATATKKNQVRILDNQKTMLANQKKILSNQADIKANQKAILANQKKILAK